MVRSLTVVIAAAVTALGVAAVAWFLDADDVRFVAEAVAMLAAGAGAALAGRSARGRTRLALVLFCLLLAAGALAELAAEVVPVPAQPPLGPSNCPGQVDTGYWRGQLRYQQAAEIFRFGALVAALSSVRDVVGSGRVRSRAERLGTGLALSLLVVIGLFALDGVTEDAGLLVAVTPGVLSLIAAVVLTVAVTRRLGGWRPTDVVLMTSTVALLLPTVPAAHQLVDTREQMSAFAPEENVGYVCAYATQAGLDLPLIGPVVAVLAAPALFVWAVLTLSAPTQT